MARSYAMAFGYRVSGIGRDGAPPDSRYPLADSPSALRRRYEREREQYQARPQHPHPRLRQGAIRVEHGRVAELSPRQEEHDDGPGEPTLREVAQQEHEHPEHAGDISLGPRERRVEDVPTVELGDGQQVEHGDQHPHPPG